jgi:hypothetical protein
MENKEILYQNLIKGTPKRGELVALFPKSPDYKAWKNSINDEKASARRAEELRRKQKLAIDTENSKGFQRFYKEWEKESEKLFELRQVIEEQKMLSKNQIYFPPFVARFDKFERPHYFSVLDYAFLPVKKIIRGVILGIPFETLENAMPAPSEGEMFKKHLKGYHPRKIGTAFNVCVNNAGRITYEEYNLTRGYEGWIVGKNNIVSRFKRDNNLRIHVSLLEKLDEFNLTRDKNMEAEDYSSDSEQDRSPIGPIRIYGGNRFDMDGLPARD